MSHLNGDSDTRVALLEARMDDWETILNQSMGELQGEMIRVTSALDRLTEEFKGLRQDLANFKGRK